MEVCTLRPGLPNKCDECGEKPVSFELETECFLLYLCEACVKQLKETTDRAIEDLAIEREDEG